MTWRGVMRINIDYILRPRPWSPSAFLTALLMIVLAASIEELFNMFGAALYFAAFFPAILITSLLAGRPAGIFATLLAIPLVWWAFMPPSFEFNPLTHDQYRCIGFFVLSSALAISFADLYREALLLFRD
jgi:K+-sensing histidine kinase KdpD